MRQIARHGQEKKYHHIRIGINSRLDTLQAAILLAKLPVLDDEINARNVIANFYLENLRNSDVVAPVIASGNESAWAQYTLNINKRDFWRQKLEKAGIPTAIYYPLPLNKQPAVANYEVSLTNGDYLAEHVLSLPCSPSLTPDQLALIAETLQD